MFIYIKCTSLLCRKCRFTDIKLSKHLFSCFFEIRSLCVGRNGSYKFWPISKIIVCSTSILIIFRCSEEWLLWHHCIYFLLAINYINRYFLAFSRCVVYVCDAVATSNFDQSQKLFFCSTPLLLVFGCTKQAYPGIIFYIVNHRNVIRGHSGVVNDPSHAETE